MKKMMIALAALLWLGAGTGIAQEGRVEKVDSDNTREFKIVFGISPEAEKEQARRRYEEIEIMGRLLDRSLARLPGVGFHDDSPRAFAFSPDGKWLASGDDAGRVRLWDATTGKGLGDIHRHGMSVPSSPQGVYLPGHGVVYTMTLPVHHQKVVGASAKPAPKTLTEWERVRKELRGEKIEPAAAKDAGDVSVADAVLKLLADNGRHVTQLGENESLTVALTLPLGPAQACAACHDMKGGKPAGPRNQNTSGTPKADIARRGDGFIEGMLNERNFDLASGAPDAAGAKVPQNVGTAKADAQKQGLLGDLHLRQGQYPQAVDTYRKTLEAYRKALEFERRSSLDTTGVLPKPDVKAELEVLEFTTKLAQALAAQGKIAEAKKVLQEMADKVQRAAQADAPPKPTAAASEAALPGKLVVSVSKKLLDQMAGGKMTFEEFRKQASVEHLTFDKDKP